MIYIGLIVAGIILAVLAVWLYPAVIGDSRDEVRIDPTDQKQVALGKKVYGDRCAVCHGVKLEGQSNWQERKPDGKLPAPPHDPSGHTWHHTDEQLFTITKEGLAAIVPGYESDMPAFKEMLGDGEIAAVLAYIKSTWPAEIRARQPQPANR
jgi:mono/diheme cytochrome c family protein